MIFIIAAVSRNNVIGKDGKIPWHIPNDMKFFQQMTMGNVVVMGRKTFESIGHPLKGRTNVILTRNKDFQAPEECIVFHDEELLRQYFHEDNIFVIGGAEIYKIFLPYADGMFLTYIDHDFDGDTFFPEIDPSTWQLVISFAGPKDEQNPYDYYFCTWQRVAPKTMNTVT